MDINVHWKFQYRTVRISWVEPLYLPKIGLRTWPNRRSGVLEVFALYYGVFIRFKHFVFISVHNVMYGGFKLDISCRSILFREWIGSVESWTLQISNSTVKLIQNRYQHHKVCLLNYIFQSLSHSCQTKTVDSGKLLRERCPNTFTNVFLDYLLPFAKVWAGKSGTVFYNSLFWIATFADNHSSVCEKVLR
jgi:hypothetical protein